MSKNKSKNAQKRAEAKEARIKQKKRSRNALIIVSCGLICLFAVILVFSNIQSEVKFVKKSSGYADPSNGKIYYPADISAYEPRAGYYPDAYGTMDGDEVYTLEGVKDNKWLLRKLSDGLFELYYEQSETLPDIAEFAPDVLRLYERRDSVANIRHHDVLNKDVLAQVVDILSNGERADKPHEISESYNVRFSSEKYGHLYFCFNYVVTDEGSYFFDHISSSYIKANGVLDGYVESLKENSGE